MKKLLLQYIIIIITCLPSYIQPVPRKDFFKEIVGMDEQTFRNTFKWDSSLTLKDPQSGKILNDKNWSSIVLPWVQQFPSRWAIFKGYFTVQTVGELKPLSQKTASTSNPKPSFNILFYDPRNPEQTDIRFLQANPANKNAAFQIASTNYGPLEGGMADPNALLTNMIESAVQGEEASISAAGATIFRKYFMPQFNMDAHGSYYYLLSNLVEDKIINPGPLNLNSVKNYTYNPNHLNNVQLGIHKDVVVTSGYGDGGKRYNDPLDILPISFTPQETIYTKKTQIISQIFTAAINLSQAQMPTQGQRDFAQLILNASYEGTVMLAQVNRIPKLYLTLMGGGAFRNSIKAIGNAITNDRIKDIITTAKLNATLIFYPDRFGRRNPVRNAQDDLTFLNSIIQFADSINNTQRAQDPRIQQAIKDYINIQYAVDITKDQTAQQTVSYAAQILNESIPLIQPTAPSEDPSSPEYPIQPTAPLESLPLQPQPITPYEDPSLQHCVRPTAPPETLPLQPQPIQPIIPSAPLESLPLQSQPTTPPETLSLRQQFQTLTQSLGQFVNKFFQPSTQPAQPQFKFTPYRVYNGDNIGWLEIPSANDAILVNIGNASTFVLDPNKGVPAIHPDYPQQPANLHPIYPEDPAVPQGLYFWRSQNPNPRIAQNRNYMLKNRPQFRTFKPYTVFGSVLYTDKFKNNWDTTKQGTKLTPWD